MEKKTNKAKLEIFKFLRISALSEGNYALSANSTKICLLGYFCMLCDENSSKSYDFCEKCKKIEK